MSMNKVKERCQRQEYAKFYYASQKMFFGLKALRVVLYLIALVPVVLYFIPSVDGSYVLACSLVSFGLTLLNEALTSFLNQYKKKAIMEHQLHQCGITGTEFSKIEYDRETTNELNELAIRKGLPQMRNLDSFYEVSVPDDISDDYTYLYLCRRQAATTKYLLSRIFYIYLVFLILVAVGFATTAVFKYNESIDSFLPLIITFYPLVSPIIKACGKCKECMKDCTKTCADIDNFFADGDNSVGRLARMHYYVQNLEFEMLTNRPTIYSIFRGMFKKGISDLEEGVTVRFKRAIVELKGKSMIQKGVIVAPSYKTLITKVDYDLETLNKIRKEKMQKRKTAQTVTSKDAAQTKETGTKETQAKTTAKSTGKTKAKKPASESKTTTKSDTKTTAKKSSSTKTNAKSTTKSTTSTSKKSSK